MSRNETALYLCFVSLSRWSPSSQGVSVCMALCSGFLECYYMGLKGAHYDQEGASLSSFLFYAHGLCIFHTEWLVFDLLMKSRVSFFLTGLECLPSLVQSANSQPTPSPLQHPLDQVARRDHLLLQIPRVI